MPRAYEQWAAHTAKGFARSYESNLCRNCDTTLQLPAMLMSFCKLSARLHKFAMDLSQAQALTF